MPSSISDIEARVRIKLLELTPRFWTSEELVSDINAGIKDLWRSTVDLKQEHYLNVDNDHVVLPANATEMIGIPDDVHKVYLVEPVDLSENGSNVGLTFRDLDYNHRFFQQARAMAAVQPQNTTIYYTITGQGGPVSAVRVRCAPKLTSPVKISFSYCPVLQFLTGDDAVPIPGEADTAIINWAIAYSRAKEREDRAPDPMWLSAYSAEKQNLLESLGLRNYSEPKYTDALYEDYWS